MNWLFKSSFFLLAVVNTSYAEVFTRGYELTVSWETPQERENGDKLSLNEISHYTVRWRCDTEIKGSIKIDSLKNQTKISTNNIWGKCDFFVNTTDKGGLSSDWSDPKTVLIKLQKPTRGGFR